MFVRRGTVTPSYIRKMRPATEITMFFYLLRLTMPRVMDDWGFDFRNALPRVISLRPLVANIGQKCDRLLIVGRLYGDDVIFRTSKRRQRQKRCSLFIRRFLRYLFAVSFPAEWSNLRYAGSMPSALLRNF